MADGWSSPSVPDGRFRVAETKVNPDIDHEPARHPARVLVVSARSPPGPGALRHRLELDKDDARDRDQQNTQPDSAPVCTVRQEDGGPSGS